MPHETLESLLQLVCATVSKSQQNTEQSVYVLGDAKDARLAYDLLASCSLDVKYVAEHDGGKLYVKNASLDTPACTEKLTAALASAPLFKQIKTLLDSSPEAAYTLSFSTTPMGRQLTVVFPAEKPPIAQPKTSSQSSNATSRLIPQSSATPRRKQAEKDDNDGLVSGPAVARKAIPKSFKTSDTGEDPLHKRILLYITGRAFSSFAWMLFILMILGLVFSVLVTARGFLCPDVATDKRTIPAYCPRQTAPRAQQ